MDTAAQFEVWQSEIELELPIARQELADAEAALAEARTAAHAIVSKREALHQAIAPLGRTIAGALHARLGRGDDELRQAENAVARAQGVAENAKATVADLENALVQTTKLITPEPTDDPVEG